MLRPSRPPPSSGTLCRVQRALGPVAPCAPHRRRRQRRWRARRRHRRVGDAASAAAGRSGRPARSAWASGGRSRHLDDVCSHQACRWAARIPGSDSVLPSERLTARSHARHRRTAVSWHPTRSQTDLPARAMGGQRYPQETDTPSERGAEHGVGPLASAPRREPIVHVTGRQPPWAHEGASLHDERFRPGFCSSCRARRMSQRESHGLRRVAPRVGSTPLGSFRPSPSRSIDNPFNHRTPSRQAHRPPGSCRASLVQVISARSVQAHTDLQPIHGDAPWPCRYC